MREIKFRAWDKLGKKFLRPYPDGFHLLGETMAFDLLLQQMYENHPEHRPSLTMLNDIEIMQYTGLKDKNGKEIYEGDILKVKGCYQDKFIVEFSAPTFCLFDGKDGVLASEDFGWDYWEQSEVIGNIYENPELLEAK